LGQRKETKVKNNQTAQQTRREKHSFESLSMRKEEKRRNYDEKRVLQRQEQMEDKTRRLETAFLLPFFLPFLVFS